jgi:hypothetical protein
MDVGAKEMMDGIGITVMISVCNGPIRNMGDS